MPAPTDAELLERVRDPADVPKFQRLYRKIDRRLTKLGPTAGIAETSKVTMQAWREVFGAEWPATQRPDPELRRRPAAQAA